MDYKQLKKLLANFIIDLNPDWSGHKTISGEFTAGYDPNKVAMGNDWSFEVAHSKDHELSVIYREDLHESYRVDALLNVDLPQWNLSKGNLLSLHIHALKSDHSFTLTYCCSKSLGVIEHVDAAESAIHAGLTRVMGPHGYTMRS